MNQDSIVKEVRRIRMEHAARFNYDLAAIFADLKESEQARDARKSPLIPSSEANAPPKSSLQRARFVGRSSKQE